MKSFKKLEKLTESCIDKVVLWIPPNKFKIIYFVLVPLFLILILPLPYINLFLTKKLVVFLISVSLLVIFRISWKKIVSFVFFLFFLVFILTLLTEGETATIIGDYIYGLLVVALISYFRDI